MALTKLEENKFLSINASRVESSALRVVVTEGTTAVARALLYRIVSDDIFGCDQLIHLSLYDTYENAAFLESVMIEITACAPNLLHGVSHSHDPSIAFKDADVVFSIGKSRGYEFDEEEFGESFFRDTVELAKIHGQSVEKYANRDVKVIVLGNTTAAVISEYIRTIPPCNITALSLGALKIIAANVADQKNRHPKDIRNLIAWGTNGKRSLPDCKYATFKDGKKVLNEIRNAAWFKIDLVKEVQYIENRCWHTRSMAYAMAEHCKLLWHGTPDGEWTCMGIASDNTYGVPPGIFFSYPVYCRSRKYEIVKDLLLDEYTKRNFKAIITAIRNETDAALKICHHRSVKLSQAAQQSTSVCL